jgi:glycerol uptake facilitator-like aquaporin
MLTNQTLPWGPTTYPGSITLGQVYLAETVATMGFIFVILTQTNPKTQISKNPTVIAFLIPLGLYIFRETVEFTGAYLNPCIALTFGGVANMIAPGQKMDNLYVYLLSGISAGIFTPLIFQAF